jgi:hypothetical protein
MHNSIQCRVVVVLGLAIIPLLSCGGSGSSSAGTIMNPSPVQAQAYTYSNASLTGIYTVSIMEGYVGQIISPATFIGTLNLDGSGNITSGVLTGASTTFGKPNSTTGVTTSCPISATGKYSLGTDASGTAMLSLAGSSVSPTANAEGGDVNGCIQVPPQLNLSLSAAQKGNIIVFQMAPGNSDVNLFGSAFKQ